MAGGDEFGARGGEGEGGDGGGVGEHAVGALACSSLMLVKGGLGGQGGEEHTAVGIEEADMAIFVPAENHTLDAAAGAGGAVHFVHVLRNASAGVEAEGAVEADRRGGHCVDACGWGAVVGFQACHAYDFFSGACIEDQDGGVCEGSDEGVAAHGEWAYAGG